MSHNPATKRFSVELRMDTLAFYGSGKSGELRLILRRLKDEITMHSLSLPEGVKSKSTTIFDSSGNDIGRWTVALEDE